MAEYPLTTAPRHIDPKLQSTILSRVYAEILSWKLPTEEEVAEPATEDLGWNVAERLGTDVTALSPLAGRLSPVADTIQDQHAFS